MDVRTQDAIERLFERNGDFATFLHHVRDLREAYMEEMATVPADNIAMVASRQGVIAGLGRVLGIPNEAAELKRARTNNAT